MERLDDSNRIAESISQKKEQVDKTREEIKGEPKALKGMEKALLETLSQSEKKVMRAIEGKPTDVHKGIMEQMSIALKDQKKELADFRQDRKALGHDVRKLDPRLAKASNKLGKLENQAVKVEKLMPKSMAKPFKEESGRIMNKQHVVKQTQGQSKGVKVNTTIQKAMENQRTSAQSQRRTITTLQTKQAAIEHAAENRLKLANEIHKATKEIDHAIKNNEIAIKNSSPDLGWHLTVINRNLTKQKESLELLGNELMTKEFDVNVNPSQDNEIVLVGNKLYTVKNFNLTNEAINMGGNLNKFYGEGGIRQNIDSLINNSNLAINIRSDNSRDRRVNDIGLRLVIPSSQTKAVEEELGKAIKSLDEKLDKYANAVLNYQNIKGQEKPGKLYGELEGLKMEIGKLKSELGGNQLDPSIKNRLDAVEAKFEALSNLANPKMAIANFLYFKPLEKDMTDDISMLSTAIEEFDEVNNKLVSSGEIEDLFDRRDSIVKVINSVIENSKFIREEVYDLNNKNLPPFPEGFSNKMKQYEKISEVQEGDDLDALRNAVEAFTGQPLKKPSAAVEKPAVVVEEPVVARDDSLVAKEVDKLYSEVNAEEQPPRALVEVRNGSYAIEANGDLNVVFTPTKGANKEAAFREFVSGALSFFEENSVMLPYIEYNGQYAYHSPFGLRLVRPPEDQKQIDLLQSFGTKASITYVKEA